MRVEKKELDRFENFNGTELKEAWIAGQQSVLNYLKKHRSRKNYWRMAGGHCDKDCLLAGRDNLIDGTIKKFEEE